MGIVTPFSFNQAASSNEVATEDKQSFRQTAGGRVNIQDDQALSSSSEAISNRMRPDSGKRVRVRRDKLLKEFKIE